jgi:hypothetical protein
MREVVFRNMTSVESRKKDIFLQEVFEKDGVIAKTERRCFYYIKDVVRVEKPDDLRQWMEPPDGGSRMNKRHFYVFKEHSDKLGEDRLLCKILGIFYVIVENCVYEIAFLHSFRVVFAKRSLAK